MANSQSNASSTQADATSASDPAIFAKNLAEISEKTQLIWQEFLRRQARDAMSTPFDPLGAGHAFMSAWLQLLKDPPKLIEAQADFWKDCFTLWEDSAKRFLGDGDVKKTANDTRDKRFKDPAWHESAIFDFIKQSYLLTSNWLQRTVGSVEGLDTQTSRKLEFYTKQFVDALSPSNFVLTNPEVLKATLESKGENLVKGLQNLLEDLERGDGKLRISMTDEHAFEIGKNLATTPGKVIYQNELMQLIQYQPTTQTVHQTPILLIPAWINKFYILDMQPDNSLVKWLVDEGHTVFVVSWVNPDEHLSKKRFEDYMLEGPIAAMDAIEQATGEKHLNVCAYCIGGTLLATTLAYLTAKGKAERVKSATYLTTMVDFTQAGELGIFIDNEQIQLMESKMKEKGYLEGSEMAMTFNMLRANDLIWSFVVNNYLLGKDPFPFDLLYWNGDNTRMPAEMHSYYLRHMYQQNLLAKPGGIVMSGVPIDIRTIKTPSYLLSTKEDHIAPWTSTYAATQLYKGPVTFTLAASGHIAGVVNPPTRGKYSFWTNAKLPAKPEEWFQEAKEQQGSWWPAWGQWLKPYAGEQVPVRKPGDGKLKVIEDAPGSYVKVKS